MIIQLHTPKGLVLLDTDNVTDKQLQELNLTRENLAELIPCDYGAELKALEKRIKLLEMPLQKDAS